MNQTFEEFCRLFTQEPLPHVIRIGKRYFYDPLDLHKLVAEKGWEPFSVGIYLGEDKGGFKPSSGLVELLAKRTEEKVLVGDKAAWLFLCGKDVLMEGVLEPGVFEATYRVIVADKDGNTLGFGKIASPFNAQRKHGAYVKRILDKGEYLRRER